MNLLIDKYSFSIKPQPVSIELKPIDFYQQIPEVFFNIYTNLTNEEINEIINNQELTNLIITEVYQRLSITNSNTFVGIINNTFKLINSLNGIIIMILKTYYGYKLPELISKTEEELLTLLIFELQTGIVPKDFPIESLKNALRSYFDEKIVDDFSKNCLNKLIQQVQNDFEQQLKELENI